MIQDLAIILIMASVVTLLFKKLHQPVVLGYILAGFLVSDKMPYMPSITNHGNYVAEWAEIGVMFLMFGLGLEFSVKKIIKQGLAPVKATLVTVLSMLTLGFFSGKLFDWSDMNCIFLGGMLAISSTAIIYKAYSDMELLQYKFTSIVMSVLILEDIVGIVLLVVLQTIAEGQSGDSSILTSLGSILLFLVGSYCCSLWVVSRMFKRIRQFITSETLLIVALGLCCFMAYVSASLNFSAALGAFIIGSVLSEMPEIQRMTRVVNPVKDLFSAVFFVSVGMMVDPRILIDYALPIGFLVLIIIVGQVLFGSLSFFIAGESLKSALRCGFSMTQIGEFSFIIAAMGQSLHVIADYLYPVVVAVSVITTFLTPYMIKMAIPAYSLIERLLPERIIEKINNRQKVKLGSLNTNLAFAPITSINDHLSKIANRFYLQTKVNSGSLPKNALKIMNRDIHITEYALPEDSLWAGKTLMDLQLGTIFNVHVSAIIRGSKRINIPQAGEILLPGDRLQVIGSDEDLTVFSQAMNEAIDKEERQADEEMTLRQIIIDKDSFFYNKNLIQMNLREKKTMVVGLERGEQRLSTVNPYYMFQEGDIVWIVTTS